MVLLAPLALALLLGHFALRALRPAVAVDRLLWVCTAWPLGLGLASLVTFAVTPFSGSVLWPSLVAELLVLAGLRELAHRRAGHDHAPRASPPLPEAMPVALRVAVWLALAAACAVFVRRTLDDPFGDADGVGIWNNRAVFWLRAAGQWDVIFSPTLAHTDYPLLVPLLQVRAWLWTGGEPGYPAAVHAAIFALCTYGGLAGLVATRRGPTVGALAALALLATPFFAAQAAAQSGDVPLACFVLLAVAWWGLGGRDALLVAGACAALAAWTKNEGLLALGMLGFVAGGVAWWRGGFRAALSTGGRLLAGGAPAVIAIAVFKAWLAPPNDLIANHSMSNVVPMLTSLERWGAVAVAFAERLVVFRGADALPGFSVLGLVVVVLVLERGRLRAFWNAEATVVLAITLLYFAIFMLSPYDLAWHLGTALDRLLLQVWPALLGAIFARIEIGRERYAAEATPDTVFASERLHNS